MNSGKTFLEKYTTQRIPNFYVYIMNKHLRTAKSYLVDTLGNYLACFLTIFFGSITFIGAQIENLWVVLRCAMVYLLEITKKVRFSANFIATLA